MDPAPSVERCSAYQLGTSVKRAVSAVEIWQEIVREVGGVPARFASVRRAVVAQPFCCSHGAPLTFVSQSKSGSTAHFRHHFVVTTSSANQGAPPTHAAPCGCSSTHVRAQALLIQNVRRLVVRSFRKCQRHQAEDWRPPSNATAVLEKSDWYNGRRVRYDVLVSGEGGPGGIGTPIEVRHEHATAPGERPPGTVEVGADAVIAACESAGPNDDIVLKNLFLCPGVCHECEEERRIAELRRRREEAMAELRRRHLAEVARERQRVEEAEAERRRKLLEERIQREAAEAEKNRQWAARERQRVEEAEAERRRKLLEEAERNRQRAEEAKRHQVQATPGFRHTVPACGSVEDVSQEEIDRRRAERIARRLADVQKSKRRQSGTKKCGGKRAKQ